MLSYGCNLFPIAAAIERGGHVSIGIGDYHYRELKFPSNARLVAHIAQLARDMGREIATPAEVRQLARRVGISSPTQWEIYTATGYAERSHDPLYAMLIYHGDGRQ